MSKKLKNEIIFLEYSGDVKTLPLSTDIRQLEEKIKNVQYILIPDGINFILIKPSKLLYYKSYTISYQMTAYSEEQYLNDSKEDNPHFICPDDEVLAINSYNPIKFIIDIWNAMRISFYTELLNSNIEAEYYVGYAITLLNIICTDSNDDEHEIFNWGFNLKKSVNSNLTELVKKLMKLVKAPRKELILSDLVFNIENDQWSLLPIKDAKPYAIIGLYQNLTGYVTFIEKKLYDDIKTNSMTFNFSVVDKADTDTKYISDLIMNNDVFIPEIQRQLESYIDAEALMDIESYMVYSKNDIIAVITNLDFIVLCEKSLVAVSYDCKMSDIIIFGAAINSTHKIREYPLYFTEFNIPTVAAFGVYF